MENWKQSGKGEEDWAHGKGEQREGQREEQREEGIQLTTERIRAYGEYLQAHEYGARTVQKYKCDIYKLHQYLGQSGIITRKTVLAFKESLKQSGYQAATVNGILTAVNSLLHYLGYGEGMVRLLKIQKQGFRDRGKQLGRQEYETLTEDRTSWSRGETGRVMGEKTWRRTVMIARTISSIGLRVSELPFLTVEAAAGRSLSIYCKGKNRRVPLPKTLRRSLLEYCEEMHIQSGPIFVTRRGKSVHRSSIWRDLQCLAQLTGVQRGKTNPHNFRHFFACTYYRAYHDLVGLSEILGHSSINTTRIYAALSEEECEERMDKLGLIKSE